VAHHVGLQRLQGPADADQRAHVAGEATLGNVPFLCDGNCYYVLLVSPFFNYRLTQKGRLVLNTGIEFATSFRDLNDLIKLNERHSVKAHSGDYSNGWSPCRASLLLCFALSCR
jgi:hypothetical protein